MELSNTYHGYNYYKLTIEKTNKAFSALIIGDTLSLMDYGITDACEAFFLRH